ncbi:orotidine 5'-phosphate decarboxylase / HUMPS family protein [Microbacterium sp. NPDC058389]|uniref:orotidine 5'-phosphate decarboxylase / HUMPS family protein n=1 Tax=Microbacterium sp. NPDC058389 TaxID=3346475 RepID=UPI00365D9E37
MTSRLQLALDFPAALGVLPQVATDIDIVEVGTPLLKRFGLSVISTVRELAPRAMVLADSKTVDGGLQEAGMLFDAGADYITALSCASAATLRTVAEVAGDRGRGVVLDTVTEADPLTVAIDALPAGITHIALHTSTDARFAGDLHSNDSFARARKIDTRLGIVLAGGINLENIAEAARLNADVVVIGRAITAAADPAAAASTFAEALR